MEPGLLPFLLLILYPSHLFQKLLNCCGLSRPAVHAFADAFNGCYKDGTNGTRDCCSFAGFYLLVHIPFTMKNPYMEFHQHSFCPLLSILFLCCFALASPYKNRLFAIFDSLGIALIACRFCAPEYYQDALNACGEVYLILYFVTLVCCMIVFSLNCCCCQKLKTLADRMSGISDARSRPIHDRERSWWCGGKLLGQMGEFKRVQTLV